jgi:hypothetical protein
MSIAVTCPGCLKRFQVNDKYAGKSGPCPSCKKIIKVPAKTEEVVVHAPEEFESGGRSTTGKLVLKPIQREETKITPVTIAVIAAAVALIFIGAFVSGRMDLFQKNIILSAIGLLLISPPTALAGYTFLRNNDLEPHRGMELYLRLLACGIAYVVLWGVFYYAFGRVQPDAIWTWGILATPFLLAGTAAAWIGLEIEPGNAFMHYAFYLIVTIIFRWCAGLDWIWNYKA